MAELQHNRQIILWVGARHSVWKTPKQGQSQVPKPVARDGASSVALLGRSNYKLLRRPVDGASAQPKKCEM